MTKTLHFIPIIAIAAILIGSVSVGAIAFADDDEDEGDDEDDDNNRKGKPTRLSFRWNPEDSSSDPKNVVNISGVMRQLGLRSNAVTDLNAELGGKIVGKAQNVFEDTITTQAGSATITTTIASHSKKVDNFKGTSQIAGTDYSFSFKPHSDVTILEVTEIFSSSTVTQTSNQERITIAGSITMCNKSEDCFEGFGTIRRTSNEITNGVTTFTFIIDELEAEIINDTGLFSLQLTKSQRITSP